MEQIPYFTALLIMLCAATGLVIVFQANHTRVTCGLQLRNNSGDISAERSMLQAEIFGHYDGVETFVILLGFGRDDMQLVSSILDAHPEMILASAPLNGRELFKQTTKYKVCHMVRLSALETSLFRALSEDKEYYIPNMWQGTFRDQVKVIGGTFPTYMFPNQIKGDLASKVKIPVKFIHIVGNPFDDIATIALTHYRGRNEKSTDVEKLTSAASKYFKALQEPNDLGDKLLTLTRDYITNNPKEAVHKLCRHLEVTCYDDYTEACAKVRVNQKEGARNKVEWTEELKKMVNDQSQKFMYS